MQKQKVLTTGGTIREACTDNNERPKRPKRPKRPRAELKLARARHRAEKCHLE